MRLSSSHCLCFVLQGILQIPWPFGENLRTSLHSWGFPFSIFFVRNVSGCGFKVVGRFSLTGNVRVNCWGFPSTQSSWWSLLLSPVFSFLPLPPGGFIQYLACPRRFPDLSGLQNSQSDFSTPTSDALGIFLSEFLSRSSVENKVSWTLFPTIWRAYFGDCISSSFCRGGENIIELIEEIVSNVLRGLLMTYLVM